jgi:hypothetical protein
MNLTRSTVRYIMRVVSISLIVLVVGGYVIWRSSDYFRGPAITIFEPTQYASLATSTIVVRGNAQRINNLLFNGMPIAIDERGAFGVISIVFPGLNIYTFVATDSFGRETSTEVRVTGTVELPTTPKTRTIIATSSEPSNI